MRILTQNRTQLIDITNADIILDCDDEWFVVVALKGKTKIMLGQYANVTTAKKELSNIFRYLREKRDTYCMSE